MKMITIPEPARLYIEAHRETLELIVSKSSPAQARLLIENYAQEYYSLYKRELSTDLELIEKGVAA